MPVLTVRAGGVAWNGVRFSGRRFQVFNPTGSSAGMRFRRGSLASLTLATIPAGGYSDDFLAPGEEVHVEFSGPVDDLWIVVAP